MPCEHPPPPDPPNLWSRATLSCVNSNAYTSEQLAMRRKAEILNYKGNKNPLTKKQQWSRIVKGNGPLGKKVWATQNILGSNPNVFNLPKVGNTLILCPKTPSCVSEIEIDISTIATNTGGNNWSIVENKTIEKCQILTIRDDITLTVGVGFILTVNGTINNNGIIFNNDTINNNGTINTNKQFNNNGGTIYNNTGGIIYNNNGGIIDSNTGATIYNYTGGIIYNTIASEFYSAGIIYNYTGGIIYNTISSIIENEFGGTIENQIGGIIYNNTGSTIDNNVATINNNGNLFSPTPLDIGCGIGTIIGIITGNFPINACS